MGKTLQTIEKQAENRAGTLASAATVKYGYARSVKQDFTRPNFAGPVWRVVSYFTGYSKV
jgi:hypothetical protein